MAVDCRPIPIGLFQLKLVCSCEFNTGKLLNFILWPYRYQHGRSEMAKFTPPSVPSVAGIELHDSRRLICPPVISTLDYRIYADI